MKRQRYVYEIFHATWKYRDRNPGYLYGCFTEEFFEVHGSIKSVEAKYGCNLHRKDIRKALLSGIMISLYENMELYVRRIPLLDSESQKV